MNISSMTMITIEIDITGIFHSNISNMSKLPESIFIFVAFLADFTLPQSDVGVGQHVAFEVRGLEESFGTLIAVVDPVLNIRVLTHVVLEEPQVVKHALAVFTREQLIGVLCILQLMTLLVFMQVFLETESGTGTWFT